MSELPSRREALNGSSFFWCALRLICYWDYGMRRIRLLSELAAWFLLASQTFTSSSAARAQDQAQPAERTETEGAGPDSAFGEVRRLSQQGKYDEALAQLEELAAKQVALKGLSHQFGVTYFKKADYPKAVESFKKALEEDPGDNEAVQLMGLSYYLAGRPGEAIAPLEKVQTWYPSANVDASYILGICYLQTKDYANARKALAKMFAVPADSAAAYLFAARMLLRQDFAPVAEEYAKKAVELDPKVPLAHS